MDQDTSPAQQRRYIELLRRKSPVERLQMALGLSQTVRLLAEAGVRSRHPSADEREVRARLTVRLYGRPAALRLFGSLPDDAI